MNQYNKAWQTLGVGGGLGAIIAWSWGAAVPETPMPPEVAAGIAGIIGAVANKYMPANA